MERSGLIEREIRGKRTYRISPVRSAVAPARAGAAPQHRARPSPAGAAPGRPRRRAAPVAPRISTTTNWRGGCCCRSCSGSRRAGRGSRARGGRRARREARTAIISLARAMAGLEQKLASVRSNQQRLTEENAKLREQLRAAQESLAQAQERAADDPAAVRTRQSRDQAARAPAVAAARQGHPAGGGRHGLTGRRSARRPTGLPSTLAADRCATGRGEPAPAVRRRGRRFRCRFAEAVSGFPRRLAPARFVDAPRRPSLR